MLPLPLHVHCHYTPLHITALALPLARPCIQPYQFTLAQKRLAVRKGGGRRAQAGGGRRALHSCCGLAQQAWPCFIKAPNRLSALKGRPRQAQAQALGEPLDDQNNNTAPLARAPRPPGPKSTGTGTATLPRALARLHLPPSGCLMHVFSLSATCAWGPLVAVERGHDGMPLPPPQSRIPVRASARHV